MGRTPETIIADYLAQHYGCHTVLLYGSRAMGLARAESDWDIIAVNNNAKPGTYHGMLDGVGEVNASIYPEAGLRANMAGMLNFERFAQAISQAVLLVEQNGSGRDIIAQAGAFVAAGPAPLPPGFAGSVRHYFSDTVIATLRKPEMPKVVQAYRSHEAVTKSLGNYFRLRNMLRGSVRDQIQWLQQNDAQAYTLFSLAVMPGAPVEALEAWFDYVLAADQEKPLPLSQPL